MDFFITAAHAAGDGAQGQAGGLTSLLMFLPLLVLMYFLMIRPQQKRVKEHQTLVASLDKGDEISTTGGILGKITSLNDNYVTIKVAKNVEIKVQKHAIGSVLPKGTIKDAS